MPEDDAQRRERLPVSVYDLAMRLGAGSRPETSTVHLTQSDE